MIRFAIGALAAALTAAPHAAPAPATAPLGPPWVSIEYPVNPYDATTRDAFLLVHSFHHGTQLDAPVSGTAEGLVNGQRRTIPLEFTRTSRAGTVALRKQWPDDGVWTLIVTVSQHTDDVVQAVVELGRGGVVSAVRVPTRRDGNYTLPVRVAMSDVESGLRTRARAN